MLSLSELTERAEPGSKVLVRADLNVPLSAVGETVQVTDSTRIDASLPTIQTLLDRKLSVVLCSHLGRPQPAENPADWEPEYSLNPVARILSDRLGQLVELIGAPVGSPELIDRVERLEPGEVVLLENIRNYVGEKKGGSEFTQQLAALADYFVNDAFGTCHRAHASVSKVAEHLPAYAGQLVFAEVKALRELRDHPARPFWVVLGGAKVSDKLGVVAELLPKVDGFVIGGAMANTFLAGLGVPVGNSKVEEDQLEGLRALVNQDSGTEWVFPADFVSGDALDARETRVIKRGEKPPAGHSFFDIGPESSALFRDKLASAATIFWNGPMGVFEQEAYAAGTREVLDGIANNPGHTVIGGGDSAAAARKFGRENEITHISTGGGASLEFLEGKELPGIVALEEAQKRT